MKCHHEVLNYVKVPIMKSLQHSDIRQDDWVEKYLPNMVKPYIRLARLDRPIGTWLLLYPCLWGIILADSTFLTNPHSWFLCLLFAVGALLMRSAGCIINDLWDQKYDQQVERTTTRPLASGALQKRHAFMLLGLHLCLSLLILMQLNIFTRWLAVASLFFVVIYPTCKRFTYFPQIVLGLTFNWGALTGWSAVTGSISEPPILLYCAGLFWTLIYDTIYAHQDKNDDARIGLKSTALFFKEKTTLWLSIFSFFLLGCLIDIGLLTDRSIAYYLGLGAIATHLFWQLSTLKIHDPQNCLDRFKANKTIGLLLTLALLADSYLLAL